MITTLGPVPLLTTWRPGYLGKFEDTSYGSRIMRITGTSTTLIPVIGGVWHKPWSRHRYAKRQPWNHGATKILIDQKGGSPTRLVLDASTYQPLFGANDQNGRGSRMRGISELQWRPGYADQMVSTRLTGDAGTSALLVMEVFDISTTAGTLVGSVSVPAPTHSSMAKTSDQGDKFGWIGEGQISDDGRYTVACSALRHPQKNPGVAAYKDYAVLIDLNAFEFGDPYDLSYCTMGDPDNDIPMWQTAASGEIGNPGISTQGNYAQIHLKGTGGGNSAIPVGREYAFILDVDKNNLTLTRREMNVQAMRMLPEHSEYNETAAAIGMIPWLSHSDFNEDSAGNEVIVGGGRGFESATTFLGTGAANYGKKYGTVLMVRLSTGAVSSRPCPAGPRGPSRSRAATARASCSRRYHR